MTKLIYGVVAAAALLSASHASGQAVKPGGAAPAELQQVAALAGTYDELFALLPRVRTLHGTRLRPTAEFAAESAFVACPGRPLVELMDALKDGLSRPPLRCQWLPGADVTSDGRRSSGYLLHRRHPDTKEEQARQRAKATRLLGEMRRDPAGALLPKGVRRLPDHAARVAMLGTFSEQDIQNVLAGGTVVVPVGRFDPKLVQAALAGFGGVAVKTPSGQGRVLFTRQQLEREGYVSISPGSSKVMLGATGIRLYITLKHLPGSNPSGIGGELLYNDAREVPYPSLDGQPLGSPKLVQPISPTERVSVPRDLKAATGQPVLATYLDRLASESGRVVVATWPKDWPRANKRLPRSIQHEPLTEALRVIGYHYSMDHELTKTAVILRQKQ